MILKRLEVGSLSVNCYIVGDEAVGEAAVFDPGGDVETILRVLSEHELRVRYILNTHSHFDHVGGNQALKIATGAPILIHRDEGPWLQKADERAALFGFSAEKSKADRYLEEGDSLRVGSIRFDVMELRGHSYVGLGYLFEGDMNPGEDSGHRKILICGDILFSGSIGRTDFPGGNLEVLLENIRTKIFTLPDDTLILPGHGPMTTVGRERRFNPFVRD
ncbi:MAG: MBL fold metallo-hydrolase [Deltaproteobacteria bacterium]|nr:MBL fold metallo-hydrolase [Deltaproteobacteria bacterium]MBW2303121.1 MBL fold metallo-hydrolase [Deltaproteobacteria bacterium]